MLRCVYNTCGRPGLSVKLFTSRPRGFGSAHSVATISLKKDIIKLLGADEGPNYWVVCSTMYATLRSVGVAQGDATSLSFLGKIDSKFSKLSNLLKLYKQSNFILNIIKPFVVQAFTSSAC